VCKVLRGCPVIKIYILTFLFIILNIINSFNKVLIFAILASYRAYKIRLTYF